MIFAALTYKRRVGAKLASLLARTMSIAKLAPGSPHPLWCGKAFTVTVNTMSTEAAIREKLMIGLEPTRLDVINESELHAGHRSSPGTGESHFRVNIVSAKFEGKSRVERHRMINDILADEMSGKVHALAIQASAPGE